VAGWQLLWRSCCGRADRQTGIMVGLGEQGTRPSLPPKRSEAELAEPSAGRGPNRQPVAGRTVSRSRAEPSAGRGPNRQPVAGRTVSRSRAEPSAGRRPNRQPVAGRTVSRLQDSLGLTCRIAGTKLGGGWEANAQLCRRGLVCSIAKTGGGYTVQVTGTRPVKTSGTEEGGRGLWAAPPREHVPKGSTW
jgi:hypothetical protein